MKLVSNWRQAFAMWSVRLSIVSGIISATALGVIAAHATIPSDWVPHISTHIKLLIAYSALGSGGVTAFLAAVARVVDQPKLRGE